MTLIEWLNNYDEYEMAVIRRASEFHATVDVPEHVRKFVKSEFFYISLVSSDKVWFRVEDNDREEHAFSVHLSEFTHTPHEVQS